MSLTTQIVKQLREVFLSGEWIVATNFKAQIVDLTWEQATTKVGSLNSIAMLTYHVGYYVGDILNVFEGGTLDIRDKYSFDLPPIESEEDWERLRSKFLSDTEKFVATVEQMSDEKMDDVFVKDEYGDHHFTIDALIEHSYYHLGQIVLIKKMVQ